MFALTAVPTVTEIADLLRTERARLGGGDPTRFPQPRMAHLLGVSLRQYQRWERGDSTPSALTVDRIRRVLEEANGPALDASIVHRVETMQDEIRALRAELAALRAQRH